jgi:hypothetical protein
MFHAGCLHPMQSNQNRGSMSSKGADVRCIVECNMLCTRAAHVGQAWVHVARGQLASHMPFTYRTTSSLMTIGKLDS